jgi:hypothetical protein
MSISQSYFIIINWLIHTFNFESPLLKMNVIFWKQLYMCINNQVVDLDIKANWQI